MFTGLIQDIGRVATVGKRADGRLFRLQTKLARGLLDGGSLAVNGVCLTVGPPAMDSVEVTAIAETLSRTTLGELAAGDRVNLEPALCAGDPLGGHLVQGHVDGVGVVERIVPRAVGFELVIESDAGLARYVAEKGSITIDGISLTVARLEASGFRVALVPHTIDNTAIGSLKAGDRVNIEVDILAKYVERMLMARGETESRISEEWLKQHGFA